MRLFISQSRLSQRGAFSVIGAGALLMSLLFLVLVLDSGRLYLEQRRLQKVADTAALESIAKIENGNCSAAPDQAASFAEQNAKRNNFLISDNQSLQAQCVTVSSVNGLRQSIPSNTGRAIQVTTASRVPASLIIKAQSLVSDIPSSVNLKATAVAEREEPTAVFTVGSQLLRLNNNKLLGQLLKAVGLNAESLTLLDADGLASATITPSGLLKALGIKVGIQELKALSPEGLIDLVNTDVGLLGIDRILSVSAQLVDDSFLAANIEALRIDLLKLDISKLRLNLFGDKDNPGIIKLASGTSGTLGSALDARINLGELLSTTILIGVNEAGRGLLIPELNLLGQDIQVGIVEPPSIGVGPVGTTAYNAQIRLYVGVDTNKIPVLSLITRLLGTRVNLPIWIDLVSGHGTLEKVSCEGEIPTVDISVESKILNVCVGKMPEDLKWSTAASCESNLQEDELIKLLGIPVLSGKTHIPALQHDDYLMNMTAGTTLSTSPNKLALGNTVEGVVSGLLDLLSGLFRRPDAAGGNSDLDYNPDENIVIKGYLQNTALSSGLYHIDSVTDLILNGGTEKDENGKPVLPPLVDQDWFIPNSIPTSCLLVTCPPSMWKDGTFSQAFKSYSEPHSILGLILPASGKGFRFCGNLVGVLTQWNSCVEHNLTKLLKEKPGGFNSTDSRDGLNIANPNSTLQCNSVLCVILKPVILLLKPILNGVGELLNIIVAKVLGLELGRTDVTVESISCGAPRLVR